MAEVNIWFLDIGHGDCTYIELPNGARMMIDCGGYDHWPSKLLKYYGVTKDLKPVPIHNISKKYGLDNLVITHPHGDHIADIESIYEEVGFYLLTGFYNNFIDQIAIENIDFRKRGQESSKKFIKIVKEYNGKYDKSKDRVALAESECLVKKARFIGFEKDMDLNELSWFVSVEIGGHKILFTGDMPSTGIQKILKSDHADQFREFVYGTTILKIPHHGRDNGCSQDLFDAFGEKPLLCIASDEVLNEKNEGTSNIDWYRERISDQVLDIDGQFQNRKVLTTRKDKDIFLQINSEGKIIVSTNFFKDIKSKILQI